MLHQRVAMELEVTRINTDSRNVSKGDLFVPLIGTHFDGHSFVQTAADKGASLSLWQKNKAIPEQLAIPIIIVPDTLLALQQLAKCYREKINPIVIGITGSNGKTTTKDLISSVLATTYHVHKTKGNLNNHIGVPLTLLSMPEDTQIAVIEMGMSHLGEIETLSKIARPDIAVITNIGESHLEFLKTRENIAKAKLEIVHGLKQDGWVILNGDEPLLRSALQSNSHSFQTVWVGLKDKNDLFPVEWFPKETEGSHFITNDHLMYDLPLLGTHNVLNALLAIQVGKVLKVPYHRIQSGLGHPELTGMRLEKTRGKNGSFILNDAYNASPTSMEASLKLLSTFDQYKKIAVLGDMLELGEHAEAYHEKIGAMCADLGIDLLLTTGRWGKKMAEGAKKNGMGMVYYMETLDQMSSFLLQQTDEHSIILIKGSRGVHLEQVVKQLV